MLGESNQGSMTLRNTWATATEDNMCPHLTPLMGQLEYHYPPPFPITGSSQSFPQVLQGHPLSWVLILELHLTWDLGGAGRAPQSVL